MKRLLLVLTTAATVVLAQPTLHGRNITKAPGGNPALTGQFPWHMTLINEAGDICSGVFLENLGGYCFMLTAAHCLRGFSTVYANALTLFENEDGRETVEISTGRWFIHPDYNPQTGEYDVGLVVLFKDIVPNDRIQMVRLPLPGEAIKRSVPVRMSGWGSVDGDNLNDVLQWNDLSTISNKECATIYGSNVTESTLCAIASGTQNPCIGDFGGPLIHIDSYGEATLHGIASFVHESGCNSGLPLGYVRVESILEWLTNTNGII